MNKIFIEAKKKETPECNFLKTILALFFPEKIVEFVSIDGIGNLFNETIVNQISLAQAMGEQVLVLADADTVSKGWGFKKRKVDIDNGMQNKGINFSYFLYPNNHDDGDVESLMELAAQRNLHKVFFDCFEDYERCVSSVKDSNGRQFYNVPNLKGKLHTYMSAQRLNSKQRSRLGSGDWLFDDSRFWNLNIVELQPLKDYFRANLK